MSTDIILSIVKIRSNLTISLLLHSISVILSILDLIYYFLNITRVISANKICKKVYYG